MRSQMAYRARCTLVASFSAFGLLLPKQAPAAAFQLREDSAVNLGTAFAGSASAADTPATVFNNPAGMTQLPGLRIQLGGALVIPRYLFHGTSVNAFGRPNTGVNGRDGANPAFVPNQFITYGIDPGLWVGLGLNTPFGLITSYGNDFVGRYQTGESSLQTININPAIAYQVAPWLSLGAGVSVQYARAEFSSFLNSSTIGTEALSRPVNLPDGYFRLKGDDWSWGYNVGALIQPAAGTNIGLAYRSRVQYDLSGTADFIVPGPLSLDPRFRSSDATAKLVLPDIASASLTQRIGPRWTFYAEFQWTDWSRFKTLSAYRNDRRLITSQTQNYQNSFLVALGASYQVNDRLTLRAGLGFDKTPITDAYRTVRVPDQNRLILAAGLTYRLMPNSAVDLGYAHMFMTNASVREASATSDVLAGSTSSALDVIALETRFAF